MSERNMVLFITFQTKAIINAGCRVGRHRVTILVLSIVLGACQTINGVETVGNIVYSGGDVRLTEHKEPTVAMVGVSAGRNLSGAVLVSKRAAVANPAFIKAKVKTRALVSNLDKVQTNKRAVLASQKLVVAKKKLVTKAEPIKRNDKTSVLLPQWGKPQPKKGVEPDIQTRVATKRPEKSSKSLNQSSALKANVRRVRFQPVHRKQEVATKAKAAEAIQDAIEFVAAAQEDGIDWRQSTQLGSSIRMSLDRAINIASQKIASGDFKAAISISETVIRLVIQANQQLKSS